MSRAREEYGAFIDIGLGRTDALMPNSMMGDKGSGAFKQGDGLEAPAIGHRSAAEVWVVRKDEENQRVTVSAVEPTAEMRAQRGARRASRSSADSPWAIASGLYSTGRGHIPVGFMIPDPKRTWEMMGERDELMDVEPTPWYEWAKKFPGLVRFQEQDQVLVISAGAYGFWGNEEMNQANQVIVKVPKHLQKPDAVEPTKEDLKISLEELGLEVRCHTIV